MIEEDLKNMRVDVATIAENVKKLTEIAQLSHTNWVDCPGFEERTEDPEAVVTACEVNGEKFVRIHVGKYDFKLSLHDAEEEMNWDDAMKYAKDKGMRLFTLEEGLLIYCFKDEVNAKLVELGGDELREDDAYWCSTEYTRTFARYVYFGNGRANTYLKYLGLVVRPVAAFLPMAAS